MIRFGLRLTVAGGREAVTRLVIIAAAVAIGVGLLLAPRSPASTRSTPRTPVRLAERAGTDAHAGPSARRRPAVVAGARRLLRRTNHRPRRRRRDRTQLAGPARHPRAARPGGVLRLTGAGPRCSHTTPADQLGDRYPRPRGRHRSARPRCRAPNSLVIVIGHDAGTSWPARRRRPGHSISRPRNDPTRTLRRHRRRPASTCVLVGRRRRAAVPGADLHRHRDPALRRPPRAALRRDAPGRRDARGRSRVIADRRVRRRRRRRHRRRLRPVLPVPRSALAAIPFTGHAVLPGRPVPRARSTSCVVALGVPVAAAVAARLALRRVHDLAARRHPPGHAAAAAARGG